MTTGDYVKPTSEEKALAYGDELGCDITPGNALVTIARELRFIRHTLDDIAQGDPSGNEPTVGEQIQSVLWDSLGATSEPDSIPGLLTRIAKALEDR